MNYKKTLNLPRTDFSMKANLPMLEPKILSLWERLNIYSRLREERRNREKFILHDGPPYANGLIHIGHALNKILKDIIVKFKMMQGLDVPFIVGWDCHGLPVEHQLFKELNLNKHQIRVDEFRKRAKAFALSFVELQKKDFKRLGIFSDWEHPYFTLDKEYEYWVLKLLEYLVKEEYIYRRRRPVYWCRFCETALAEAEVEYFDKESESIYFTFQSLEDKELLKKEVGSKEEIYFLVWTTTPWTLISNVAVAVHPSYEYVAGQWQGKILIFAKELLKVLEEKLGGEIKVKKIFLGREFEGIKLKHPFLERTVSVVLAEFVSNKEGSGCVHIAPGHGEEDFSLVDKYGLEVIMPLDEQGVFGKDVPQFCGKNVNEAEQAVIGKLEETNSLLIHEKILHSYPFCWRCRNPIIFRATFQWFLDIEHNNLRERVLSEIENVKWIPPSGEERIKSMVKLRPDWCLSRQRLWGIPIPALKCEFCKEVFLDHQVIATTAEVFRKKGSDSWFVLEVEDFIPEGFKCPKCGGNKFFKETDILDVWFESGASFLAVVKNNPCLSFPATMYLEGSDQHRGWFQVSLIPSVAREKKAPFKVILTHGFVVDGEGRKMSKSLGNIISPQEIIDNYGAEILRLWAAYSDYSEDVKISPQILRQLIDIYRKVRNTLRFILGNLYDFQQDRDSLSLPQLIEVDRYIVYKTRLFLEEVLAHYEEFSFYKVCQKVFNFCNLDLSSFYLDILKDRLYTYSPAGKERKSAQTALYYILKVLTKIIAPILSFTAEEVYQIFWASKRRKVSVYFEEFEEDLQQVQVEKNFLERWAKILSLRQAVLKEIEKKREEKIIGSSLEAVVEISSPEEDYRFYKEYEDVLREVFIASKVNVERGDFGIVIKRAEGKKCLRCWNYREDVGSDSNFADICLKCVEVIKGGENG
ncbi:MAG: isoleucine--tRNA ligase [Candidatus Omnitrophica bacterium 4484_70.2]|nr:MAG: isoleucine--tRNA ligase [Candidatus Omnitrophica bacterium 4484_70.2]